MYDTRQLIPSDTQIQPNSNQTTATTLTAVIHKLLGGPLCLQRVKKQHIIRSQYFNICPLLTTISMMPMQSGNKVTVHLFVRSDVGELVLFEDQHNSVCISNTF